MSIVVKPQNFVPMKLNDFTVFCLCKFCIFALAFVKNKFGTNILRLLKIRSHFNLYNDKCTNIGMTKGIRNYFILEKVVPHEIFLCHSLPTASNCS